MHYVFLIVIAALAVGMYLLLVFRNVPGAVEERLGVVEPLPVDLGVWKADEASEAAEQARAEGLGREVRTFMDEGRLVRQVRYRSLASGDVVRAEPDQPIRRRRIKRG